MIERADRFEIIASGMRCRQHRPVAGGPSVPEQRRDEQRDVVHGAHQAVRAQLPRFFPRVGGEYQTAIYGVLLVLIMIFFPSGIVRGGAGLGRLIRGGAAAAPPADRLAPDSPATMKSQAADGPAGRTEPNPADGAGA